MYLSIFIAILPNIINPVPAPNTTPEKMLFLFLSLIALIFAPVPKTLCIAVIINYVGYINENILIRFLSTNIPSKNQPKIGVTEVTNVSKPILNNLFISCSFFIIFNFIVHVSL